LNIKNSQIKFNEDRGRWPANFIVDQESADLLDQQSGVLNSGKGHVVKRSKGNGFRQIALGDFRNLAEQHYETFGDSGGASRFFFQYQENQIDEADLVKYTTKASNAERDAGISRNPTKVNDGRPSEIDNPYQRGETERINIHPTTKPIDLTRYLASILLPPEEYGTRRLFVPFAGVASEMIGGLLAGWDEAVGVEMEKEYVEIGNQRLQHWQQFAPVPHVKDGPIQQTLF
jgi:site-specific DNA-methyltransferase (adenine-specific)